MPLVLQNNTPRVVGFNGMKTKFGPFEAPDGSYIKTLTEEDIQNIRACGVAEHLIMGEIIPEQERANDEAPLRRRAQMTLSGGTLDELLGHKPVEQSEVSTGTPAEPEGVATSQSGKKSFDIAKFGRQMGK